MRVIVAGTRDCTDYALVCRAIEASCFEITELVEGGAPGADRLGRQWAIEHNIPYITYEADWRRFGRSAGPRRNLAMAREADALIAVWDGASPGTKDMIDRADARGLPVFVQHYERIKRPGDTPAAGPK